MNSESLEFVAVTFPAQPEPTPAGDIQIQLRRGTRRDDYHLAGVGRDGVCGLDARAAAVIRVDAVWLSVEPLNMRAGTESALAGVVTVLGAARPHTAYLFANRRANRMKVLVHDGIGIWLAARRLNTGKFVWPSNVTGTLTLSREHLRVDATPADDRP